MEAHTAVACVQNCSRHKNWMIGLVPSQLAAGNKRFSRLISDNLLKM